MELNFALIGNVQRRIPLGQNGTQGSAQFITSCDSGKAGVNVVKIIKIKRNKLYFDAMDILL
jgi:hypothetical protein